MERTEQMEKLFPNHPYLVKQRNNGLTRAEFTQRLNQLGNINLHRISNLSHRNGHTYRHPRTSELVIMKTSDVLPKGLLRKDSVAYAQQTNRTSGRIFRKGNGHSKVEKWVNGDKRIKSKTEVGRKTGQWKSIWYSRNSRRK